MKEVFDLPIITSSYGWNAILGVTGEAPVLWVLLFSFLFFFVFIIYPLYFLLGFTERKLAADLQARVGPNRTAGNGLFQVFADTLKLGFKEDHAEANFFKRFLSSTKTAALYSMFAFLPLGTSLVFLDSDVSVFLPFACFGVIFLVSLFISDGSMNLEDEIMAHRETFLWLSAWIPALIAVSVAVARTGSARWTVILSSQSQGPFSWTLFSSPFGFISFFIFIFSGLVALQLPPFHSIDRGVRYRTGSKLALYNLDQFYSLFTWCILASALFLGGHATREISDTTFIVGVYQLISTLLKASGIFVLLRVVARALPQLRQDQMTEFCWRVLTPMALVSLIGELFWTRLFAGGFTP